MSAAMGNSEATQEILRAVKTVRPLPDVAHRVLGIVQNPDYEIDDLVSVVRTDPTLVARVLRLCNSARTGLDRPITSIGDAITYLGSRNLVQLVLVTCSAGMFAGSRGSMYSDPLTLWQHSVGCAIACQAIAARTGEAAGTTAFTLGILHDVGKVALSRVVDEARLVKAVADSDADPTLVHTALEARAFGIDHALVSGLVADHWQLPPALAEALRGHHDEAVLTGGNALPAILHVADLLTLRAGIGNPFPRAPVVFATTALTRLGLDAEDLDELSAAMARELAKAAELLNLDVAAGR
jgi:HD-like signal output (HDOD) protein